MNKVMKWLKGNQYKFSDPEYAKYFRQAYKYQSWVTIIFGLAVLILILIEPDNHKFSGYDSIFFIITAIFMLLSGYCIGAANAVESADKYQAKKDKKNDEIPTL